MKLFNFIKNIFSFPKMVRDSVREYNQKVKRYLQLTNEELKALPQEELIEAISIRTENKAVVFGYSDEDYLRGINALSYEEKLFYSLDCFEAEINNGGLCQFFVNSSRVVAPYISEYLQAVGAEDHKALFDNFVNKYNINLHDLSEYDCDDVDEFAERYDLLPFDEFDEAFYKLKEIQEYLTDYVIKNIDAF